MVFDIRVFGAVCFDGIKVFFMKEFGKNILMALLMILAIYQTAELWFGDFSSHNFFSLVFNSENVGEDSVNYTMERMLINTGDNRIICRVSGIYDSDYKQQFDNMIGEALSKGELYEENAPVDWKDILSQRCIVYEYGFVLRGSTIEDAFGVHNANTDKIKYCNRIIAIPQGSGRDTKVILYNSRDDSKYIFTDSKKNNAALESYGLIGRFASADSELNYISSEKNGFDIFRSNIFIPQWRDMTYTYDEISSEMTVNEEVSAEENADVFFDNPAGKWKSVDENGNITFSNENTVIKYYENGVLEYTNYKTGTGGDDSFAANYKAACSIIKKDSFVKNEYYLCSYNDKDGKYVFYFDYKIDDMVIRLGSDLRKSIGMSSMLEVTASNGRVNKYKRYACAYEQNGTSNYASVDFVTAADDLYNELDADGEKPVENLELAFVDNGEETEMKWIIGIDGKEYVRSVRSKTGAIN